MSTPVTPPGLAPAAPPKPFPTKLVVTVVVVVVALVVVLAFVVWPLLLYQQVTNSSAPPTAVLAAGLWQGGNLTITVNAVGGSYTANVNGIAFSVYDRNGSAVFLGNAGEAPLFPSSLNLTYQDWPGTGHGVVSVGDTITIHGPSSTPAAHGRFVMHMRGGSTIGELTLP